MRNTTRFKGAESRPDALCGQTRKALDLQHKNYPGYEGADGTVQANILVYEGAVIGGDVCSTELDGFMQGFDFPTKTTAQS